MKKVYVVFVLADEVARFDDESSAIVFSFVLAKEYHTLNLGLNYRSTKMTSAEGIEIDAVVITYADSESYLWKDTCVYYQIIEE